jgi:CHAT domain-containing protein
MMLLRIAFIIISVSLYVGLVSTSILWSASSDTSTSVEQSNNHPQQMPEGKTPLKTVKPDISFPHNPSSEEKEKVKSASSEKTYEADKLFIRGREAFDDGNLEEAIEIWEKTANTYASEKEPAKQMDVLSRLAVTYQDLGHYAKSLEKLESGLALSGSIKDRDRLASVYGGLGQYFYLTGEFGKSNDYFVQGLAMAEETGNTELTADIQNNYGNFMTSQQRFPEAIAAYKGCMQRAEETGRLDLSVRAGINLARVYVDRNKLADARLLLEDASKKISGLRDSYNKVFDLIAIGRLMNRIYLEAPDKNLLNSAYNALQTADTIAGKLTNRRASSYASGYLGALYEQGKRYEDALLLTRKAILAAQQSNTIESLYRWYWQKGRIEHKQGEIDEAIIDYRHALQSLNAIRQDVSTACTKRAQISFREAVGPVYFELADLLLQRSSLQKHSEQVKADLIEARNTVEQLKGAELQDYFRDDCVVALKTKTKNLDQIIQRTAVVYFILLTDRIELLVSVPSGLNQFTIPVQSGSLNYEVTILRNKLEHASGNYMQNAQKLYDWLIRPLEKLFIAEQIDTLIFVPDGMLRTIPMGALHDGDRFLISKYTVVTTPGITLTDPQPISREHPLLLLGGLSEAVQGFPALPSVTSELQTISKLYDSKVFQDKEFTNSNIEMALKSAAYNIVHIASHGQFDSDPQKTFLLTYNDKLSMNQLEKIIGQNQFSEKAVELLTLSACQTAVGDDRAALGLAGIAIKAGARSAVASLWAVSDEATAQLMIEFYRQLLVPANSKATAMQKAQQKLLKNDRFSHPAYWAPFILIGNWL